jgi:excisionase family DNA binding protein
MEQVMVPPVEAGTALGIGKTKVFELIASGELPSVQIGRKRLIPVEALYEFARTAARTVQPTKPAAVPSEQPQRQARKRRPVRRQATEPRSRSADASSPLPAMNDP